MKLIRLVLAIVILGIGLPANAHDQLVEQSPADGDVVEAGLVDISLDFNNQLLNLAGSGAEILVSNSRGESQNLGCALVSGKNAQLKLSLAEPGPYFVTWRVVSSDGHPLTGSFGFELVNNSGYEYDPNYSFIACEQQAVISPEQEDGISGYWLLWVSLGLVAAGLFFYLRPNRKKS
jgi:copper resistance protein C